MWSNPEWTGLRGWDAKVSVMADLPPQDVMTVGDP